MEIFEETLPSEDSEQDTGSFSLSEGETQQNKEKSPEVIKLEAEISTLESETAVLTFLNLAAEKTEEGKVTSTDVRQSLEVLGIL